MDLTLCQSLINWLKRFPDHEELTTQKLTDGIAIARILNQIAPEFFSAQWLSKIKQDVGDNWRLKVSNLRKIHEGMMDYYRDHLDQPVRPFPAPNLNKIGEHSDEAELGRLLQLVLGCAVNCQQKKRYIEAIMEMEENVQTVIVKAIQELMIPPSDVTQPGLLDTSPQSPPDPSNEGYKAVHEQLEATTREKDLIVQRCNELDHQLSMVTEERNKLKGDIKHLEDQLDDPGLTNNRVKELRKKIETLQDELYKIETSRDDYRVRVETLEKENMENNALISEREILATKVNTLQDEVDALREMKEKVPLLEGTIESYKKKQEELGDLRRQVKILQDKNSQYMQQNLEVEEDLKEERKRSSTWRPQLDLLRDEVNSLRQKISDEIKKSDRLSFDNKKLNEKMEAEIEEKKRIQGNYQLLKEKYDELKYSAVNSPESSKDPSNYSGLETVELIPHEIREQLARLKLENTTLKKQCNEPDPVLQSKLEDLSERHDKLLQENRELNQRVMELESDLDDAKFNTAAVTHQSNVGDSGSTRVTDLERELNRQTEKISTLEDSLLKKEADMVAMEERYKRYLNKAKSVIKTLDPKHNPSLVPDVSVLRSQLLEKEKLIENMERESEKAKRIRETEEKLISTAFYNIGMQRHRQMLSQRLANLDHSQPFLSRQRQTSARRNMSNVSNSEFQF